MIDAPSEPVLDHAARLPRRRRALPWVLANVLLAIIGAFALVRHIDAQLALPATEVPEGFEGLARVTALTMLILAAIATYVVLRLGAAIVGGGLAGLIRSEARWDARDAAVAAVDYASAGSTLLAIIAAVAAVPEAAAITAIAVFGVFIILAVGYRALHGRHVAVRVQVVTIAVAAAATGAVLAAQIGRVLA